jgi:hypothetical protein
MYQFKFKNGKYKKGYLYFKKDRTYKIVEVGRSIWAPQTFTNIYWIKYDQVSGDQLFCFTLEDFEKWFLDLREVRQKKLKKILNEKSSI